MGGELFSRLAKIVLRSLLNPKNTVAKLYDIQING